ncbi:MAG: DUF5320 domain-containing protein [bacterium]
MPSGDRTGPAGLGPMTGRGLGHCAGSPQSGFASGSGGRGMGRGWGRGRGMGFGCRRGAGPGFGFQRNFPSGAEMRSDLEAYRDELKRELAGIEETMAEQRKKD